MRVRCGGLNILYIEDSYLKGRKFFRPYFYPKIRFDPPVLER